MHASLSDHVLSRSGLAPRLGALACGLALATVAGLAHANEIIKFRSGEFQGGVGVPGDQDDNVECDNWGHPVGAALSAASFTLTDLVNTRNGDPTYVIRPHPAWMGGVTAPLSDPKARWINFKGPTDDGMPGSCLYAVPFDVTSTSIGGATLSIEGGVDDALGDWAASGANQNGLYINGVANNFAMQGFNSISKSTYTMDVTNLIHKGTNFLYFYQRDTGQVASGLIYSATVTIVPAPGALPLLTGAGLVLGRRARRTGS